MFGPNIFLLLEHLAALALDACPSENELDMSSVLSTLFIFDTIRLMFREQGKQKREQQQRKVDQQDSADFPAGENDAAHAALAPPNNPRQLKTGFLSPLLF